MSLWKIAWRSIQQRSLSSWLTGLSMALGVALVVTVLVIHGVISRSFSDAAQGYHLIVGAKGGRLQLVLNTVFHLSQPIENIPWEYYKQFIEYTDENGKKIRGKYASTVEVAVPYLLGDSYQDFRVVGTTPDLFGKLTYGAFRDGTPKRYAFAEGDNFHRDDYSAAVVGSVAAARTGLRVGDRFPITHGLAEDENAHVHEEDLFHVVGVLEPTGTPNDRAIFINLEGFLLIEDHARPVQKDEETAAESAETLRLGPIVQNLQTARGHLEAAESVDEVPAQAAAEIKTADEIVEHVIDKLNGGEAHDDHEYESEEVKPSEEEAEAGETASKDPAGEQDHGSASEDPADEHEHATDHSTQEHSGEDHDHHDHEGHDHDRAGHASKKRQPLPEEQREVTAVLLLMKADVYAQLLANKINEAPLAQAVFPGTEVALLFQGIVGHVKTILLVLAVLVIIVAGIGVMVSIYNSMSDRSREIAIMRALGADRTTVMLVVLMESILLSLLGGIGGVLLGHAATAALSPIIVSQTGVSVGFFQFEMYELILIPALVLLAALVGYLPAVVAYRTDVARALSATP